MNATYDDLRPDIKSGDVLSVRGRSLFSKLIMFLTEGDVSHSAMALWIDEGLWVWEIREGFATRALRLTPASLYIEDQLNQKHRVWWSKSPQRVRDDLGIEERALSIRHRSYGWWSLLSILWSQWRDEPVITNQVVCSVAIQRMWEASGVSFRRLATPQLLKSMCSLHTEITG